MENITVQSNTLREVTSCKSIVKKNVIGVKRHISHLKKCKEVLILKQKLTQFFSVEVTQNV